MNNPIRNARIQPRVSTRYLETIQPLPKKMLYDHIASVLPANRISQLIRRAPADADSPEKLSALTGIPMDSIKQMEEGKLEPTLNMAYKLAAAFQIPLENLFADDQKVTTSLEAGRKSC
jgi:DNA-binding XRE family transcriptional regulator